MNKLKSLILNNFFTRSVQRFWWMQLGFWAFLCFVSVFTLSIWYDQNGLIYLAHTGLQAVLGMFLSLPLVVLYRHIWEWPYRRRLLVAIIALFTVSLLWTALRIHSFSLMTGAGSLWSDFGNWAFGSIFIFACWTGVFHGLRYYQLLQAEHDIMLQAEAEAREEQVKRMMAQTVARDAKIKMLRYQLNPHFLCNTLNAINSLIECDEAEKAQRVTVQLSNFLRYSLDHNPDTKISLENEIHALNLYLEIEKTRFEDRLKLDFNIDALAKSAHIPSLLLQPIIENSMKHVIAQNEDGGTISLRAQVQDQRLIIEISDTGTGQSINKSKLTSKTGRGIGLKNIDERLKVLYKSDYLFDLHLLPMGGLKTTIDIPYECLLEKYDF
ncbi:sensor histidine kinase [Thalassotalea aquiviva]|uniref:sensor histidine kinase n=1 Tax=Thalassotalea aquiviva TaxID=3242415 RepID=UPI00352AFFB7